VTVDIGLARERRFAAWPLAWHPLQVVSVIDG
jgi:hypothetical protein